MIGNYENIILFIIVIIVSCYFLFRNKHKTVKFKNILTKDECQDLINTASKIKFDTTDDSVDARPVYQIDILRDKEIINKEIWKDKILPIYNNKLKPLLSKLPWTSGEKLLLNWVFIKRYMKSERTHLRSHFDSNFFTFNILLSDKKDFKGGDLYIFDNYHSNKYKNIIDLTLPEHDAFIKTMGKNLPVVKDYDQGDILSFIGENHLHGTLPVYEGERYVLVLFFEIV